MRGLLSVFLVLVSFNLAFAQADREKTYKGKYKGNNLLLKNPYSFKGQSYCIKAIYVNGEKRNMNLEQTSIEVDLSHLEKNTPVQIRIIFQSDCAPLATNLADIL